MATRYTARLHVSSNPDVTTFGVPEIKPSEQNVGVSVILPAPRRERSPHEESFPWSDSHRGSARLRGARRRGPGRRPDRDHARPAHLDDGPGGLDRRGPAARRRARRGRGQRRGRRPGEGGEREARAPARDRRRPDLARGRGVRRDAASRRGQGAGGLRRARQRLRHGGAAADPRARRAVHPDAVHTPLHAHAGDGARPDEVHGLPLPGDGPDAGSDDRRLPRQGAQAADGREPRAPRGLDVPGLTVRRRALPWLRGTGEGRDPADRGGRRRALQGGRDGLSLAADEDQGARSRRSRAAGLPRRDYYKDLGKVGHGTTILSLYSTYAIPKGTGFAKWAAFRKAYQDRYGTLPGLLGVSAYDVVHIAAGAIERAGSLDRKKIIEALGKVEMDQMVLAMQGGTVHRPRAPRRGAPLPGGPSARGRGCDDAPRRAERAPRPRSLRPRLRARARTCHPRGLGRDAPAPPPGTDRLPGPRGVGAHGGLARVIPSNCACR